MLHVIQPVLYILGLVYQPFIIWSLTCVFISVVCVFKITVWNEFDHFYLMLSLINFHLCFLFIINHDFDLTIVFYWLTMLWIRVILIPPWFILCTAWPFVKNFLVVSFNFVYSTCFKNSFMIVHWLDLRNSKLVFQSQCTFFCKKKWLNLIFVFHGSSTSSADFQYRDFIWSVLELLMVLEYHKLILEWLESFPGILSHLKFGEWILSTVVVLLF